MASRIRVQCPNCLTPYKDRARFCSACGRARDEKSDAEMAAEISDPNRSVMLTSSQGAVIPARTTRRSSRPSAVPSAPQSAEPTSFSLPSISPGVVFAVAIVFFGLVWIGRWANAPQKATRPVVAPISVAEPDEAEVRRVQRQLEAKEKQDLREAEEYADGIRANVANDQLQAHLRSSQAPPPSGEPQAYNTIPVAPLNQLGAVNTDSQGNAYPPR